MDFTATVAGSTDSAAPTGGRMWSVGAGPPSPYWRGLFGGPRSARPWAAGIGHMFLDDGKGGVWGLSRAVWRAGAGGGRGPTRGAPTGGPHPLETPPRQRLRHGRSGHRHSSPRAPHPRQRRRPRKPQAKLSAAWKDAPPGPGLLPLPLGEGWGEGGGRGGVRQRRRSQQPKCSVAAYAVVVSNAPGRGRSTPSQAREIPKLYVQSSG